MERILAFEPASVLDIGAGVGGSCLPLAERGVAVTALERDEGMAEGLRDLARRKGPLRIGRERSAGPMTRPRVGRFDVVTASHVVHNVPDLGPFLLAMEAHASRAVVIQEFSSTSVGSSRSLLPGAARPGPPDRPDRPGPGSGDRRGARGDAGLWRIAGIRTGLSSYRSWDELLDFYGRRLVLPPRAGAPNSAALLAARLRGDRRRPAGEGSPPVEGDRVVAKEPGPEERGPVTCPG